MPRNRRRSTLIRPSEQDIKGLPSRIRIRFSIRIERITAWHKPVAEIGPLFFRDILSTVFAALTRHTCIEVAAHLAHVNVSAALWALVSP